METGFGLIIFWIVACMFTAGIFGSEKKIGFWNTFFLSLFLSPIIGVIAGTVSKPVDKKCRFCGIENPMSQIFCIGCGRNEKGFDQEHYRNIANSSKK